MIYFHDLLKVYPHETFFQYVLLQSQQRHGVSPPAVADGRRRRRQTSRSALYQVFSRLAGGPRSAASDDAPRRHAVGDLNVHISQLARLRGFARCRTRKCWRTKIKRDGKEPAGSSDRHDSCPRIATSCTSTLSPRRASCWTCRAIGATTCCGWSLCKRATTGCKPSWKSN